MRRAQSVTSAPAGVRREPCGERSSTVTPSIRSMERMRSPAAGWLTPVSRAARPRLPSRATARSSSSAPSSGTRCASPGLRRSPGRCCSSGLRRSPCLRCSSVPIRPPYALIGVYSLVGARGRDECGGHDRIPAGRPRHPTAGRPFHGGALHRDSFRRDFHRGSLPGGCLPGRSVPGGVPRRAPGSRGSARTRPQLVRGRHGHRDHRERGRGPPPAAAPGAGGGVGAGRRDAGGVAGGARRALGAPRRPGARPPAGPGGRAVLRLSVDGAARRRRRSARPVGARSRRAGHGAVDGGHGRGAAGDRGRAVSDVHPAQHRAGHRRPRVAAAGGGADGGGGAGPAAGRAPARPDRRG